MDIWSTGVMLAGLVYGGKNCEWANPKIFKSRKEYPKHYNLLKTTIQYIGGNTIIDIGSGEGQGQGQGRQSSNKNGTTTTLFDIAQLVDLNSTEIKKKKFQFPIHEWGADLQSEHERYLVEKHFKSPVILFDYPANIKAFYMRLNEDGKTVRAMDVLFPGIGEIVGGSQREERYEVLVEKMKALGIEEEELWWYLDLRKFGTAVHSGFGLGFERLVQFVTGMGNIRDVIPYPRTPQNAEF